MVIVVTTTTASRAAQPFPAPDMIPPSVVVGFLRTSIAGAAEPTACGILVATGGYAQGERRVMEFRLLGPVEVRVGTHRLDVGQPRQRVVLAALLCDAGRVVGRD